MTLTSGMMADTIVSQAILQLAGCSVLAFGIVFEIRCGSVTMPGEGITVAVSKASGLPFPKTKIIVDTCLVVAAVVLGYVYLGAWQWRVVGIGTVFAMIYVGAAVKFIDPHIKWFERVLRYRPGFRRYIFGLARYIYRKNGDV